MIQKGILLFLSSVLLVLLVKSALHDGDADVLEDGSDSAATSSLWLSSSNPFSDVYHNVFKDAEPKPESKKRRWTSQEVRERVWQTQKDVQAMENHIEQQNAMNKKMKKEVSELEDSFNREKKIIHILIENGMADVDAKLDELQDSLSENVTDVDHVLRTITDEVHAKEAQQDQYIADLNARHLALAGQTQKELAQVNI